MTTSADEPIPYELTEDGWTAARATEPTVVTWTAAEAVAVAQTTPHRITQLARRGVIDAVKVDGVWLVDGASVAAYRSARPVRQRWGGPQHRRLPAEPLLRQIELAGGVTALGSRRRDADLCLLERAAREGSLTIWAADHLAVSLLGLTLWELWPDEL